MDSLKEKVLLLYPQQEVMDTQVDRDRQKFLAALEEAVGSFLRTGPDDKRDTRELVEPITAASKRYERPRKLEAVAIDLGLPERPDDAAKNNTVTAGELSTAIKSNKALQNSELKALTTGEVITRKQWELVYQRTAYELGLGTPLDVE